MAWAAPSTDVSAAAMLQVSESAQNGRAPDASLVTPAEDMQGASFSSHSRTLSWDAAIGTRGEGHADSVSSR